MGLLPPAPPPKLGVPSRAMAEDRGAPSPASSSFLFIQHLSISTPAAKPRDDPIPGCEAGGARGGEEGRGSGDLRGHPEGHEENGAFSGRTPRKGILRGPVGPRTQRLQGPTGVARRAVAGGPGC